MAANSVNAETVRDYLTTLLATALVGTNLPAKKVINYWSGNVAPDQSVVMVCGAGDEPSMAKLDGAKLDTWVYLEVQIWVLYADTDNSWTTALAEDKRDAIKTIIKNVVVDNRGKSQNASVPWDFLTFAGRSTVGDVLDDGGLQYILESVPLKARVING